MEDAAAIGVSINGIKVADWAEAEYRRKIRAERRVHFFAQTRSIYVLLFVATILVFIYNHQVEIQSIASAELHRTAKRPTMSDKLREQALKPLLSGLVFADSDFAIVKTG